MVCALLALLAGISFPGYRALSSYLADEKKVMDITAVLRQRSNTAVLRRELIVLRPEEMNEFFKAEFGTGPGVQGRDILFLPDGRMMDDQQNSLSWMIQLNKRMFHIKAQGTCGEIYVIKE